MSMKTFTISGPDVEVSDGYHTMHELYEHRMALNIALFHAWFKELRESERPRILSVVKSWRHYDGTMFDGYFVVRADTMQGQISYHYKAEHWDKFNLPVVERTGPWDGSSSLDTLARLIQL